jgi:flagellar protein FlbD
MIPLTRLNNQEFFVNCDLIEFIERTPDTVITLTTGKKFVVKEDPKEVIRRIVDFRRSTSHFQLLDAVEQVEKEGEL